MLFELIDNTKEVQNRLINAVKMAKKSVKAQFMTFEADNAGIPFAQELINARKRNVDVHLLVDGFMTWKVMDKWLYQPTTPGDYRKTLRTWANTQKLKLELQINGARVKVTNPIGIPFPWKLIRRSHKKLLIVDDNVAYVGGYNFSNHNYGWQDTFTRITKESVVSELTKIFDDKEKKNYTCPFPIIVSEEIIFQSSETLISNIFPLVENAKDRIYIQSPYFINDSLIQLVNQKSKEGVKVAILLPDKNNSKYITKIHNRYSKKYKENIIFVKNPNKMFHAKHIQIDNYSYFGSCNLMCSKYIDQNEELMIMTPDKEYNKSLRQYFEKMIILNK